jgi:sarcosine oxidase delta subunit
MDSSLVFSANWNYEAGGTRHVGVYRNNTTYQVFVCQTYAHDEKSSPLVKRFLSV